MSEPQDYESRRATSLLEAERTGLSLFDAIVEEGIIQPGKTERQITDAVRDLAAEKFGITRYWHKRVVRSGPNALLPYEDNPPNRILDEDDIVFFDFGPLLEQWEVDLGRTYVLGDDPAKHKMVSELYRLWRAGRDYFNSKPDITGHELFDHVLTLIKDAGYSHGSLHAGHLVGEYPHTKINCEERRDYVTYENHEPMRRLDGAGRQCHWILEIHLADRKRGYGAFCEQLLDL
ncbi:M24 family metallopeptidase [Mycolicibacterium boenickei]